MYEIIMLFAFLCAATSQLFPGTPRGDNPDLLKKKRLEGKARKRTKASVPKQKTCHNKPVRRSNRKPVLHVRHDRLRQGWERANGIKRNSID